MDRTHALVGLLLCLVVTPSFAGDKEAIEKYKEALAHWDDPDPAASIAAAQKAFDEAISKNIRLNALLMLGRLHSAKTGNSEQALIYYDQIVEAVTLANRDRRYWGLKSSALVSKANILVAEKDDLAGGLKLLNSSYDLQPTATNTNVLSQLILRISQDEGKDAPRVRGDLQKALNYAKEAVSYEKNAKTKRPKVEAKYRLQLALVLTVFEDFETDTRAKGKLAEELAKARKALDRSALDEYSSYEHAQYLAVTGEDAEAVAKQIQIAMDQRPAARARNLLRKWIRGEPFFQRFLEEPSWKGFITDEPKATSSD